jgi:outer membrane murein-binding lipoprotein Lpp
MKLAAIVAVLMLSGCSVLVPVKQKWPEAPASLQEKCSALKELGKDQTQLKDLLMVMIDNYAAYYVCAGRTQGWQEWYQEQKKIQEKANK